MMWQNTILLMQDMNLDTALKSFSDKNFLLDNPSLRQSYIEHIRYDYITA